jgi:hypothetical protein
MDTEESRKMLNDVFKAKEMDAEVNSGGLDVRGLKDGSYIRLCCYLPEFDFVVLLDNGSEDYNFDEETAKRMMIRFFAEADILMEVDDEVALTIDCVKYTLRTRSTYAMCEPESDSDGDGMCRCSDEVHVDASFVTRRDFEAHQQAQSPMHAATKTTEPGTYS